MDASVVFGENDKDLLEKIEAYRKQHGITFEAAVKELCEIAFEKDAQMKWGAF